MGTSQANKLSTCCNAPIERKKAKRGRAQRFVPMCSACGKSTRQRVGESTDGGQSDALARQSMVIAEGIHAGTVVMVRSGQEWTKEERYVVRKMVLKGASDEEIAAAIDMLGRIGTISKDIKALRTKKRWKPRKPRVGPPRPRSEPTVPTPPEPNPLLICEDCGLWTDGSKPACQCEATAVSPEVPEPVEAAVQLHEPPTVQTPSVKEESTVEDKSKVAILHEHLMEKPKPTPFRTKWSGPQRVALREAFISGLSDAEIADHLQGLRPGCTEKQIGSIRSKMGLLRRGTTIQQAHQPDHGILLNGPRDVTISIKPEGGQATEFKVTRETARTLLELLVGV